MTPTQKVTFRAQLLRCGEKVTEILSTTPKLHNQEDAKTCVKIVEELHTLMHDAQLSLNRATRTLEVAAGYSPYHGSLKHPQRKTT